LVISKRCEVCGGNVTPIDDQSPFGSCDSCGIVYALKDKLQGRRSYGAAERVELRPDEEPREPDEPGRTAPVDNEEPTEPLGSRWRCPDCGTLLKTANASDLEFLKREHIREYHPNRSG
jgi:predicted RNA-binding Zn-ribbon protein involved in translation (DUF1610 family)